LTALIPQPLRGCAQGLELCVHSTADIHISAQIRERGLWEPFESELVCAVLGAGDVFVDVGANIGYFSVLGARQVGAAGRVYAFEPEPRNFALLSHNVALNGFSERVVATAAALGDSDGQATLYLHPDNLGDHQLYPPGPRRQQVSIDVCQGQSFFSDRESRVKLVKVDTQGTEAQVVEGLMPLLKSSGPELNLIVELTPLSLRDAGSSGALLVEKLAGLKLPIAIVDHIEHRLVPVSVAELVRWCNNVDSVADDAGFMNIFLGPIP
jgi:FkbM family methyltransferase